MGNQADCVLAPIWLNTHASMNARDFLPLPGCEGTTFVLLTLPFPFLISFCMGPTEVGDLLASPPLSTCVAFCPCLLICGIKERVERVVPLLLSSNPSNLLGTPFLSICLFLPSNFFPFLVLISILLKGTMLESEN